MWVTVREIKVQTKVCLITPMPSPYDNDIKIIQLAVVIKRKGIRI